MSGILDFWKKYHLGPMKQVFKTTTLGGNPKANLAIAAALIGGGTLLPGLLGGAAAGAAGGVGSAAAGGAAAGAGGTLGGTAGMFGAAPGMASSFLTPAAVTPAFTSSLAGMGTAGMGGGTAASLFGPSAAEAASLAALSGPGAASPGLLSGLPLDKVMKGFQMAGDMNKQGQQEQPPPPPMPRPQVQLADMSNDELRKRLMKLYGGTA
jgi:hypothetical protein